MIWLRRSYSHLRRSIIIVDGPPASGKSTLIAYLSRRNWVYKYNYKRLGLVNIFYDVLMILYSGFKCCELGGDRDDKIMQVDAVYLKRLSGITFLLEVVYKIGTYFLLLVVILLSRFVIVDEGIALGWANYLYLMAKKKALKPAQVLFLMRIDIMFIRIIAKISNVSYFFIDRNFYVLERLWRKRGNWVPYDRKYYALVKLSFKLLSEMYLGRTIKIRKLVLGKVWDL
jgi:hypothetical protein